MHEKLSVIFLVLYTLSVVLIGLYNRGSKDSTDYFLGGRKLPAWLLAITFIASWWGGGSAIDLVDHAHEEGLASFWIYGVPVLIAAALMYFMAEFIRNESSISQPELFAHRYNKTSGFLLTLFILIFMILGAAVQVIVIGHFFQSFFQITYTEGALIGTSIVLFYSLFGGFKGVVLTDLLQFIFFMIGGLVPHLVKQFQNPWISAFIFVGLCSAIMSTMDSMFNTAALSLTNDIYDNYFNRHSEGKNNVLVGRLSTFLVAACAFFIGVRIESVLTISWIGADFLATGAFVPLILGIFWKRGKAAGAVACMSFGLFFSSYNLLVALGVNLPIGWTIASATQTSIGMLCSLLIYLVVSLLFHRHTLR
ncbi:MAG: sodium:solute symporter family protein [Prevotella sp.]